MLRLCDLAGARYERGWIQICAFPPLRQKKLARMGHGAFEANPTSPKRLIHRGTETPVDDCYKALENRG